MERIASSEERTENPLSEGLDDLPRIISVDDHVIEPPHLWKDWLPQRFRESAPRVERRGIRKVEWAGPAAYTTEFDDDSPTKGDIWVYEGRHVSTLRRNITAAGLPKERMTAEPVTFDEIRPGMYQPKARLEDMDTGWVEASMCFPTMPRFCGQTFYEGSDRELGFACVQAYNDWMVEEWCGDSGGRLVPLTIIPLWDAEAAAAEVRRNAARGVRAVCFSELPFHLGLPTIHSGHWDPFFRACAESKTAIAMHIGSSSTMPKASPDAPPSVSATLGFQNAMSSLTDFLMSGKLIEFPDLKLLYAESQIGWIPYVLQRVDQVWDDNQAWAQTKHIPEPPSTYYFRNIRSCFINDPHGVSSLDEVGVETVMFETDYPHSDTTWPATKAIATRLVADLSPEDRLKILRTNAIELLNISL